MARGVSSLLSYQYDMRGGEEMKRILVVEDNEANMRLVSFILERAGFEIIKACNGTDGVALAVQEVPNLILMDIQMPGLDGFETVKKIKEKENLRDIPIIFLTALFPKREGEEQGQIVAGHVFIAKPYDIDDLLNQIEKLINVSC